MPLKTNPENAKKNMALHRPEWIKVRLHNLTDYQFVKRTVSGNKLNTVCESAHCPNIGECWSRGTATFMILGNTCTRSCQFCNIRTGKPTVYDKEEPERVAKAIKEMNLRHAVITQVARDDLRDGGAGLMAETIRRIKKYNPKTSVEVLISDLKGSHENLMTVLDGEPDILNHNLETVKRLQYALRVQATYERSMRILKWAKEKRFITKSGIMVGVGEMMDEIMELFKDLRNIECDIITIGQYLPPTKYHYPIERYYHPEEFRELKRIALEMGFSHVESGPLVRSSYHAEEHLIRP